jgi:hypothetical protein
VDFERQAEEGCHHGHAKGRLNPLARLPRLSKRKTILVCSNVLPTLSNDMVAQYRYSYCSCYEEFLGVVVAVVVVIE